MNETGHEMFATLLHPVGLANRQGLRACLDFPIKHLFQQYAVSANKRIQTWPNKTSNLAKSVFLLVLTARQISCRHVHKCLWAGLWCRSCGCLAGYRLHHQAQWPRPSRMIPGLHHSNSHRCWSDTCRPHQ